MDLPRWAGKWSAEGRGQVDVPQAMKAFVMGRTMPDSQETTNLEDVLFKSVQMSKFNEDFNGKHT